MTVVESNDESVKPMFWTEFIGQTSLMDRLSVHINAALIEKRPLEHILLAGPPGSGKTTLAGLIPKRLGFGYPYLKLNGVGLDRKQLIARVAPPDFRGGVLFIDEIHALGKKDQEFLLDLLGNGYLGDTHFGWITVIGATTERDKVITPLYDRFPIKPEFEPYTDEELGQIATGMAERLHLNMDTETAEALGRACGGIPRNAKQFVFAYRAIRSTTETDKPSAEAVLEFCQIDPDGLTELHRRYLQILKSQDGKAGARTLEGLLRIPSGYCRELERLLIDHQLITYSSSGRVLTTAGRARTSGMINTEEWSPA